MDKGPGSVERRRRELELTREDLWRATLVSVTTIKRLEGGQSVSGRCLKAVCARLGLDPRLVRAEIGGSALEPTEVVPVGPVFEAPSPEAPREEVAGVAGDGSAWATAWREVVVGSAAIAVAAFVGLWHDVARPHADPRSAMGLDASFLVAVALATAISGVLVWRGLVEPRARMRTRVVHVPLGGRAVTVPALSWRRPDGGVTRCLPGMVLGFAALAYVGHVDTTPNPGWRTASETRLATPAWAVAPGSVAEAAGIRLGDRVATIDGHRVDTLAEASATLATGSAHRASLVVWRLDGRGGEAPVALAVDVPAIAPCAGASPCGDPFGVAGLFAPSAPVSTLRARLSGSARDLVIAVAAVRADLTCATTVASVPPSACARSWIAWRSVMGVATDAATTLLPIALAVFAYLLLTSVESVRMPLGIVVAAVGRARGLPPLEALKVLTVVLVAIACLIPLLVPYVFVGLQLFRTAGRGGDFLCEVLVAAFFLGATLVGLRVVTGVEVRNHGASERGGDRIARLVLWYGLGVAGMALAGAVKLALALPARWAGAGSAIDAFSLVAVLVVIGAMAHASRLVAREVHAVAAGRLTPDAGWLGSLVREQAPRSAAMEARLDARF